MHSAESISQERRSEVIAVCERAFADDFSRLFERRPGARHAIARINNETVGHGCWQPWRVSIASQGTLIAGWIDAIATDPPSQGRGIGTAVMTALVADLHGVDIALLSAAQPGFYARLGWRVWPGTATGYVVDEQAEPIMYLEIDGGVSVVATEELKLLGRIADLV